MDDPGAGNRSSLDVLANVAYVVTKEELASVRGDAIVVLVRLYGVNPRIERDRTETTRHADDPQGKRLIAEREDVVTIGNIPIRDGSE